MERGGSRRWDGGPSACCVAGGVAAGFRHACFLAARLANAKPQSVRFETHRHQQSANLGEAGRGVKQDWLARLQLPEKARGLEHVFVCDRLDQPPPLLAPSHLVLAFCAACRSPGDYKKRLQSPFRGNNSTGISALATSCPWLDPSCDWHGSRLAVFCWWRGGGSIGKGRAWPGRSAPSLSGGTWLQQSPVERTTTGPRRNRSDGRRKRDRIVPLCARRGTARPSFAARGEACGANSLTQGAQPDLRRAAFASTAGQPSTEKRPRHPAQKCGWTSKPDKAAAQGHRTCIWEAGVRALR